MKIHLVYAGSPDDPRIQSPYSITRNLYYYLKARADVSYYTWDSYAEINPEPDDIFIGHPHYDPNTTVQRFFNSNKKCRMRCTIHPLHTNRIQDNMPFNEIAMMADKIFSICGPYWYDTIDQTPFAHWKPKIVRLDMAVDSKIWKYQKTKFNDPGRRNIVYIGSSMPQKNLGYLYDIVKSMPNTQFRWYGGSGDHPLANLKNMKIYGWCDFNDQNILREIYDFADIFLNVSNSDANPTTLLEFGLAGGLIPICTETSGYWKSESFINITHNLNEAISTINTWLTKPTLELENLSIKNRTICEKEYTWDKFCSTIWKEINNNS